MKYWIAAPGFALALAACDASQGPPTGEAAPAKAQITGFSHAGGEDLFGYYLPTQPVQVGNYRLDHIHVGDGQAFLAWEAGDRMETYGPVMLEFSDVTSPQASNELGQEFHTRSIRVLPRAYRIGEGDFRFVGAHPEVGEVVMDGQLDLAQLEAEKATNGRPQDEAHPVLRMSAQIGAQAFRNLSFTWFGGD